MSTIMSTIVGKKGKKRKKILSSLKINNYAD